VTGMLGFSYLSVPLYRLFCASTGYGGTVSQGRTVEDKIKQRSDSPDMAAEECASATFASRAQCRIFFFCCNLHTKGMPCVIFPLSRARQQQ
jgi:cytochrome c oxidase assembly protein Cox11